uniref:CST complex subunit Ten1 n=1 Tax=Globisporangium ultimum (strain ATCC 200006 / CBS 805.95 / DAOM BR144) TaxID=431595 RepID=K3WMX9_GLOUD
MATNFCEIVQIAEVLRDAKLQNRSVRITGRLDAYDAQRNLARVSFQNAEITVDTRILSMDGLELRIGSMYQFLGETQHTSGGQDTVRLVARVARNVDSLDMDLFLQALALRRQFLATHDT